MKLKSFFLIITLLFVITIAGNAQKFLSGKNIVKLNLAGLPFRNFTAQYERILKKRISLAVSVRSMPMSKIPFRNEIIDYTDIDNPDVKESIEKFEMSNFSITPELRFYLIGKGQGRGFYIAPFYRYANFKTNEMIFTYEDALNVKQKISLSGNISSNTVGALLGIQFPVGKYVRFDW